MVKYALEPAKRTDYSKSVLAKSEKELPGNKQNYRQFF